MNPKSFSIFCARGGAANVRGIQVADFLGAKLNPTKGYENDICIYVKITPPEKHPKSSYLDVVDADRAVKWLKTHPKVGVIAISQVAKDYLQKTLKRKDVVFIPHHHCNYESWVRPFDREVKTVGVIGSRTALQYPVKKLRKQLKEIGLELRYEEDHWKHYNNEPDKNGKDSREKVCNFHKTIDIQVVWRPEWRAAVEKLRSPLKLENAGSFGIPTVAFPEPSYLDEWNDCFIETRTIDHLLDSCKELKENRAYYQYYGGKALSKAQAYHHQYISELYKYLPHKE